MELITSSGNYSRYRQRFSECTGFRFPILGVHLKDLIAVHVALPDWTDTEKTQVNLTKTQQLYAILQELALIQAMTPKINANPDLLNLLIVSLGIKSVGKHGLNLAATLVTCIKGLKRPDSGWNHAITCLHYERFWKRCSTQDT